MISIVMNDLDNSQELDKNSLTTLFGGRWVQRNYSRRYTRRYYRSYRVIRYYYTTVRRWYTRTYTQRYTKWVWV